MVSDDIANRLVMFSLDDGTNALNKLLGEASDEIERLRKNNNFWHESFLDIHKELIFSLVTRNWQSIKKIQMKMWNIRKTFEQLPKEK